MLLNSPSVLCNGDKEGWDGPALLSDKEGWDGPSLNA